MNFSWSDEESLILEETALFSQKFLNDDIQGRTENGIFDRQAWDRCGEFGLLGLMVEPDLGGMGFGALMAAGMMESFGFGCRDGGLVFSVGAHLFAVVAPIHEFGSDSLKRDVLPDLISGKTVGANAITEAESGSDIAAMKTTALRDEDEYVLNGIKSFVTNAPVADKFLIYATVNSELGFMGVSAFVVDRDTPGLTVGKNFDTIGLKTSPMSSIYLDNCRIHKSQRLGEEGAGSAIFAGSMQWERACLFGGYLGAMERQLERVIEFVKTRRQFRQRLAKFQAVSHKITDMKIRLDAARLLLHRACWLRDQGEQAVLEVSEAKLAVSEAAIASGLDAIQIIGGLGFINESEVGWDLVNAIPATIFSGTSEIQRNLMAQSLGL